MWHLKKKKKSNKRDLYGHELICSLRTISQLVLAYILCLFVSLSMFRTYQREQKWFADSVIFTEK